MLYPFFTYYGGKWRSAPKYPSPETNTIIEPFAGSAGYSLRYPEKMIILYDTNPIIVATWRYLLRVSSSEVLFLPDVHSDQTVDDLHVCEEAKYLIGWWLNKGTTAPGKSPSKWMRSKVRQNSFWGEVIRSRISNQLEYIRHWKVIEDSYEKASDIYGTWFVDPPYFNAGKYYPQGSKTIDYKKLSWYCTDHWKGQVIVCEQQGANWLPFTEFYTTKALEGKRGHKTSQEVFWTRSSTKLLLGDLDQG